MASTPSLGALMLLFLLLEILAVTDSFFASTTTGPLFSATTRRPLLVSDSTVALWAKSGTKKKKPKDGTICVNRNARRNYEILETLEAGISLKGTEVKSIRDGKMDMRDGFVKTAKNGRSCTLMNVHIGKHSMSGAFFQHEEKRPRDLLVHRSEARKLMQKTELQGMTIVPLKAYFNSDNKVKIQIALCKGKNVRDKRADIKERDVLRDTNRIIKNFRL
jgi:SsrA-binding protein